MRHGRMTFSWNEPGVVNKLGWKVWAVRGGEGTGVLRGAQDGSQKANNGKTNGTATGRTGRLVELAVEELLGFLEEGVGVIAAEDLADGIADGSQALGGVERPLEVVLVEGELLLPVWDILDDDAEGVDVVEGGLPGGEEGADEFVFLGIAHGNNGCRIFGKR